MPLYLGLDCSTQSLTAIVIEISGNDRRIVFQHSLNFDRDLPEYATTAGVRQGDEPGVVYAPPLMWADALDRVMAHPGLGRRSRRREHPRHFRIRAATRQRLPQSQRRRAARAA